MKTAVFFIYIWPEPKSSAAGLRSIEVLTSLQEQGWQIKVVSSSRESVHSDYLKNLGMEIHSVPVNDSNATVIFRDWNADLVLFDRFVMEEQFGWRARESWPSAMQLIDTQDLHFVRRAREKSDSWEKKLNFELDAGEGLLRELSSFYRVDGVLVVSDWEKNLLVDRYKFPADRLLYLPLFSEIANPIRPLAERADFCFLGNFRHPPNADAVKWLVKLWPLVREKIPGAILHLYGAYPPAEVSKLKNGIEPHGPIDDHREALSRHKALLAPLRFGAGMKGKVLEAWSTGTPVIGTPFAFEGMGYTPELGISFQDESSFVDALFSLEDRAAKIQTAALLHVEATFSPRLQKKAFQEFITSLQATFVECRKSDLVGRMLRHHMHNSTKYFSRWIEEKNRK